MQGTLRRTSAIEVLYGLVAMLLSLVAIGAGYVLAWPLNLDIGSNDNAFVQDFGEPERGNAKTFRWTLSGSTLVIPQPPLNTATILALQIEDSRSVRPELPELLVRADGSDLARFTLAQNVPGTYIMLVPPAARPGRSLLVELQANTTRENMEGRALGVVLFGLSLTPVHGSPWLPSAWVALCAICLGAFMYLLARLVGAGPPRALLVVAGAAALVAIGVAARPAEVLPFIQRFAGMAATAGLGVALARLLAPIAPGASPSARLRVSGAHLPIYLALGAWMLLLYQVYMVWDGAEGIGPALWDVWIGGVTAAGLGLGLMVWSATGGRQLQPDERRARRANIAIIALGLAAGVHIGFSVWYAFTRQAPDFWILFKGVREWARGGSLYNLNDVMTNHFGKVFKVPPFYGMFFAPFVLSVGGEVLLLWHRVMNSVLLAGVALIWLRMWRLPARSSVGAALLIVLSFRPLFDTMSYGQIDLVLLFILTLTLWALREERDLLAGVLVALATLFKLYPVVLLAFFVIKRQWRGLWGFALGMLIFNGIAVAVMGWEMHRVYLTQVVPNIGGTTAWIENQTISGFLARLAAPPTDAAIFTGRGLRLLGTLISGLVGLA
ncbi:MAG: DUF2029 domain-containing protein, partial [Oscillochloris sp.]|nr:DUF2029 domain-containing protein [Oscillochloris sp.]